MKRDQTTKSGEYLTKLREERGLALSLALGRLIMEEREERGWTQTDLARLLGMRQSGVATWEKGPPGFGALYLQNVMALEDIFRMPRGAILHRLGVVAQETDFTSFVYAQPDLAPAQKVVFRDLYRVFKAKEWTD